MMVTLQQSTPEPDTTNSQALTTPLSDLHNRLDSLWTTYLNYLDTYTTSQKLLQKHMSAGFLSLARANFNAKAGVRRYGQDFYSERAVASRRVNVSVDDESERPVVEVVRWRETSGDIKDGAEDEAKREEPIQEPSPPATPSPEIDNNDEKPAPGARDPSANISASDSMDKADPKPDHSLDPLRWFGILVPPSLRSAQSSFSSAVGEAVADAVNAAKRMRETEVEIRRVRKEIRRVEKSVK